MTNTRSLPFKQTLWIGLVACLSACAPSTPEQRLLIDVNEKLITPLYTDLAVSSRDLASATATVCGDNRSLDTLQTPWRDVMTAWQKAQTIQFGPIREHNLAWEFQFWPDKKNLIAKKLRPLLSQAEQQTQQTLSQASVVTHGLPAMEYLLFDDSAKQRADDKARCALLTLMANNLATTSQQLQQQWQAYQPLLLSASPDNTEFPTEKHAVAVVIDSFLSQTEQMSGRKLTMALGLNTKSQRVNPYFLESWRSQHSKENLLANLAAIKSLMTEAGLSRYLAEQGQQALADNIQSALSDTQAQLTAMTQPLFEQMNQQNTETTAAVQQGLEALTRHFKVDIPNALGIQLGFNNNDGD
ncbi:MAG: hypothetical protein CL693_13230 [Cellvibrionaceae bacterium]|nr:hypothetical protein [Cellvibrionaceae bacterium]|tara:strand:+ start:27493 stop:28560 length:1068 start_codon:yes stop_codon:yes gene_type:complete